MALLSSRTVAAVQKNVNAMLTDTCTLQRRNQAVGSMGEPLQGYVNVQTGVTCRVIRSRPPTMNTTQPVGGAVAVVETFRLICPVGTPFLVEDRVLMSDDSIYQVMSVEDKLTDGVFVSAIIQRVR